VQTKPNHDASAVAATPSVLTRHLLHARAHDRVTSASSSATTSWRRPGSCSRRCWRRSRARAWCALRGKCAGRL
jgi:hypothetical protein